MSTGMISSLYESTVWEEITGEESVSTISILAKASEENIDILLISKDNLSTEIEKLNTDSTTKQSIINAVNSGNIVTIPSEDVTIGGWHGTGYIVTNPETGTGAYMISGGLNGGALTIVLTIAVLCAAVILLYAMAPVIEIIVGLGVALFSGLLAPIGIAVVLAKLLFWSMALIGIFDQWCNMFETYNEYLQTGNLDAAESSANQAKKIGFWGLTIGVMEEMIAISSNVVKLSKNVSEHILKNHCLNRVKTTIDTLMSKGLSESAEKLLRDKTFFNPNWSESKIIKSVEKAYNMLLRQNAADGIYEMEVFGEKISIYIENGTISSAWGDYQYTLKDLGY